MKNPVLRSISLAIVLVIGLSACAGEKEMYSVRPGYYDRSLSASVAAPKPENAEELGEGYFAVASTEALTLFYSEDEESILLRNNKSGGLWSSTADWKSYGFDAPNPMRKAITASLLELSYADVEVSEAKKIVAYSHSEAHTVQMDYLKGGISLTYTFTKLKITITMELTLTEKGLCVSIPSEKIKEGERNLLLSVKPLPAFGASHHTDEGYILQPTGCGSLMKYEEYLKRSGVISPETISVYSSYSQDIVDYYETTGVYTDWVKVSSTDVANLPVFGVRKNGEAFIAYATLGDANSRIVIGPEGYLVDFNRICFELEYRNTFEVVRSNISAGNASGMERDIKIDKKRRDQDYAITYTCLSGDDANYSGMARAYRSYLLGEGILQNKKTSSAPLALELFCGIEENRILFNQYMKMTSFEEAETIMDVLRKKGVTEQLVTLLGWEEGGYGKYPGANKVASQLGGASGFAKLREYVAKNPGLSLFLRSSPLLADSKKGTFSIRREAVYQNNTLPFSNDEEKLYLFSTTSASKRVFQLSRQYEGVGLSLDGVGKFLYDDFASGRQVMRTACAGNWQNLLASLDTSVAVETGNQYTLAYADYVYEIPCTDAQTIQNDQTIPFLQMVLHGSVVYSSDKGNLTSDMAKQKLKWIEYGCIPLFELTYQSASSLKYTDYTGLYTSYYEDWVETAVALYKEFNDELAGVWDSYIEEHRAIDDEVVVVTYSNGTNVYINYGETDVTVETVMVPALDYTIRKD